MPALAYREGGGSSLFMAKNQSPNTMHVGPMCKYNHACTSPDLSSYMYLLGHTLLLWTFLAHVIPVLQYYRCELDFMQFECRLRTTVQHYSIQHNYNYYAVNSTVVSNQLT